MTTVNTLMSGGQGVAIPSGFSGNYVTWSSAPTTVGPFSNATYSDWNNANIVLNKGVWEIKASISAEVKTTNTAAATAAVIIALRDGSSNVVNNIEMSLYTVAISNAVLDIQTNMPICTVVNVTSDNSTYKLSYKFGGTTGGVGAIFNQSGQYSSFYAVKIA
jgi:hypothetical protein